MSIKEICLRLSLFIASLYGQKEKEEDDLADLEELELVRIQQDAERREAIQREFIRLAHGATMGDVISWGKEIEEDLEIQRQKSARLRQLDREKFMQDYGRHGSDI